MGGKYINKQNPGATQYNFLNPDNRKGLVLSKDREWVTGMTYDFKKGNIKMVKKLDKECQELKNEIEEQKKIKQQGK